MFESLAQAARVGLPVIQHAEDTRITQGASMNAGALSFRLGLRGMSVDAESGIVERDIELLARLRKGDPSNRAHLHVAHLSTAKALEAVRRAKRSGLHVTCEVAPHHFALTQTAIGDYNTDAKMNPPLRSEEDRAALIGGILDGTVDAIATDHAPHALHEKEQDLSARPTASSAWKLRWVCHCWCWFASIDAADAGVSAAEQPAGTGMAFERSRIAGSEFIRGYRFIPAQP